MAENSFDVDIQKISGTKNLFYTYLFLDTRKPGVYRTSEENQVVFRPLDEFVKTDVLKFLEQNIKI